MGDRKFGGKKFKLHSLTLGRKTMEVSKKALRAAGYLVRVVTKGRSFTIYKRRK